jgi:hypothetical protein
MKKGIGPQGLGASKSPAKMYGAKSPAKQTKEQNYIVEENKKADKKLARENDIKDSYKAREAVKSGGYANYDEAKKNATKSRVARYGFPESVSDK